MSIFSERQSRISISITNHYRSDVFFTIIAHKGIYEISSLFIEVNRFYRCVPGAVAMEGLASRTNYTLFLSPAHKIYPLYPPTVDENSSWILRGGDVELFSVHFQWPMMMAVDVNIRAKIFDLIENKEILLTSDTFRLQRNGEELGYKEFIPKEEPISMSQYLYKLITVNSLIDDANTLEASKFNKNACEEIAVLFRCKPNRLEKLIRDRPINDLMFETGLSPIMARRIIEIAPTLIGYSKRNIMTTTSTTILFLAADPFDASRLRLGEEFREIDEQLTLAKQRNHFNLALPQLSLRPKDIARVLLNTQPQIVHFSGHGTPKGALCFENEIGKTHDVQPDALAALFEQFADQVNCVVLNACYSDVQATAIAEHINYVIGMNNEIGDKAAIAFAIGFYGALAAGRTIEDAYKLGCVQIRLQGIPEHLTPILIKKRQA